ncbi:hypothetical protein ABIA71_001795 [Stenotrophomonas sp. 2619]|uniref:hypothetical protein n=1 Tax=Stenotrophomonas sp. 2619 TaxID=3156316 RepID=UPI00339AB603
MQHVARYLAGLGLALSFGFAHAQTPGSYGLHERSIERINGAKDLGVLSGSRWHASAARKMAERYGWGGGLHEVGTLFFAARILIEPTLKLRF